MGFSTIGSGLGTVALAPLINLLLQEYSYFGAMFIMGAIMLNNCVSGALYRPVHKNKNKHAPQEDKTEQPGDEGVPTRRERLAQLCNKFAILANVTFLIYGFQVKLATGALKTF